ncbi:hypothetical protein V6669_09380 [Paenibacillus sp. Y5S-9]|uniref:hypothetical protein n=1 Tax=Paenibacillus sp. Y5S-9 TaxID=3122489 RepID=UPI0030D31DBC
MKLLLLVVIILIILLPHTSYFREQYIFYSVSTSYLEKREYVEAYYFLDLVTTPIFYKKEQYKKQAISGQIRKSNEYYEKGDLDKALRLLMAIPEEAYVYIDQDIQKRITILNEENNKLKLDEVENDKAVYGKSSPFVGMPERYISYTILGEASLIDSHRYSLNNAGRAEKHVVNTYSFKDGSKVVVKDGRVDKIY